VSTHIGYIASIERESSGSSLRAGSGACLEAVHAVGDRSASFSSAEPVGEAGVAAAAVEQFHAQLHFEVGQCLADHGLRPVQLAPGRGEAAFLGGGDKGSQLVNDIHPAPCIAPYDRLHPNI